MQCTHSYLTPTYKVATPNGYETFDTYPDAYAYAVTLARQLSEPIFIDKVVVTKNWIVEEHGEVISKEL